MKSKILVLMVVISLTFISSLAPLMSSKSSSVSVGNISPKFQEAYLKQENGIYNLTIIATDYNGWENIF